MGKSLIELFLELAQPNEKGESRWVYVTEFVGKYKSLELGNGWSWGEHPLLYKGNTKCKSTEV